MPPTEYVEITATAEDMQKLLLRLDPRTPSRSHFESDELLTQYTLDLKRAILFSESDEDLLTNEILKTKLSKESLFLQGNFDGSYIKATLHDFGDDPEDVNQQAAVIGSYYKDRQDIRGLSIGRLYYAGFSRLWFAQVTGLHQPFSTRQVKLVIDTEVLRKGNLRLENGALVSTLPGEAGVSFSGENGFTLESFTSRDALIARWNAIIPPYMVKKLEFEKLINPNGVSIEQWQKFDYKMQILKTSNSFKNLFNEIPADDAKQPIKDLCYQCIQAAEYVAQHTEDFTFEEIKAITSLLEKAYYAVMHPNGKKFKKDLGDAVTKVQSFTKSRLTSISAMYDDLSTGLKIAHSKVVNAEETPKIKPRIDILKNCSEFQMLLVKRPVKSIDLLCKDCIDAAKYVAGHSEEFTLEQIAAINRLLQQAHEAVKNPTDDTIQQLGQAITAVESFKNPKAKSVALKFGALTAGLVIAAAVAAALLFAPITLGGSALLVAGILLALKATLVLAPVAAITSGAYGAHQYEHEKVIPSKFGELKTKLDEIKGRVPPIDEEHERRAEVDDRNEGIGPQTPNDDHPIDGTAEGDTDSVVGYASPKMRNPTAT